MLGNYDFCSPEPLLVYVTALLSWQFNHETYSSGLQCNDTDIGHNLHINNCDTSLKVTTQELYNNNVKVKDFTSDDDLCTVLAIKQLWRGEVQLDERYKWLSCVSMHIIIVIYSFVKNCAKFFMYMITLWFIIIL